MKINKNYIKNFLIGILSLNFIIVVHELGHFLFCKMFKVGTPVFSIGFKPTLFNYKIGNTDFQIGAIPLGGYVQIDTYDLNQLHYKQQLLIMLGGILFNIMLSLLIFAYLYLKQQYKKKLLTTETDGSKNFLTSIIPEKLLYSKSKIMGPIGIMNILGTSLSLGLDQFLYFIAVISFNIAIFNLLPIPFLDGGQIFIITTKAILGFNYSQKILDIIYYITIGIFIVFNIWILIKDLINLKRNN